MGTKAKTIRLGKTGIETVQNAFGALPIQRVSEETAVAIVSRLSEMCDKYELQGKDRRLSNGKR